MYYAALSDWEPAFLLSLRTETVTTLSPRDGQTCVAIDMYLSAGANFSTVIVDSVADGDKQAVNAMAYLYDANITVSGSKISPATEYLIRLAGCEELVGLFWFKWRVLGTTHLL